MILREPRHEPAERGSLDVGFARVVHERLHVVLEALAKIAELIGKRRQLGRIDRAALLAVVTGLRH